MIFREVEDRDLISRARKGSLDAYNVLVSRWEKRVFNYLLKLVGNREDALDLTQDVFLKAHQAIRKLEDDAKFSSWIFRIAHNEAFSLLRKPRRESEMVTDFAGGDLSGRLYPSETALAVASALNRLSSEQREVVTLKIYEGFKFEEIADVLETPVSTIKSRLYSALDVLKTALAPIGARQYTPYPEKTMGDV
ncbi:MAG TPA: sigma-70 family RNA polymerase sigma factor [Bryobacteraceae bacterium]|nr:sigma-70 family RNA polymerase sigma factor [Bryobacteraceae bacterium]